MLWIQYKALLSYVSFVTIPNFIHELSHVDAKASVLCNCFCTFLYWLCKNIPLRVVLHQNTTYKEFIRQFSSSFVLFLIVPLENVFRFTDHRLLCYFSELLYGTVAEKF